MLELFSVHLPRCKSFVIACAIAAWFLATSALMAGLMVGHWYALPTPAKDDAHLSAGLAELAPTGAWSAVHVLYSECRCSRRVIEHVLTSERPSGLDEVIVLVGHDEELELRVREVGFELVSVEPGQLYARFGIESAPLLAVVDPSGSIRYLGGYTARQQGPHIQDLEIARALLSGEAVSDLPVFGCGTSKRLTDFTDPFAIKQVQ